uniref:Uncharacterized protein n=1 Tax=Panagrolaimus sp. PS1159 TaxID=55785 RepID=A0AC35FBE8_9BILA
MLPPNIIYGHSFPRINENNNNNATINHHQKDIIHHYFPQQHHHPMFFVDGVWHRMPIAPFILPQLPLLFVPPSLEDVFDYNNAIHIEANDDDVLGKEIQLSEYGLRRLTSNEITEDDLAFLKSADKILCTMEESSTESSKESSPLLLSPPPSANSSNFSPIFLPSSPSLIPPSHSRKPTTAKRRNTRKSILKSSPSKRAYRKSSATATHYSNEHFPKLCTASSLPPRPRKQPPPLCIPSLDISREFVGFCNVLKVNPYYAGCTGRVTTFKDEINHTYFVCANCGTRRRYMEKSNSNSSVLD